MIRSIGVKNLSKETIRAINKMIAAILAEPDLYDQNTFGEAICKTDGEPTCGTTCCAAGWAVWLDNRKLYDKMMGRELRKDYNSSHTWTKAALKALHLEVDADYDTAVLFGAADEWPRPFSDQYERATTAKARAQAFARRWRHFIKRDGQE